MAKWEKWLDQEEDDDFVPFEKFRRNKPRDQQDDFDRIRGSKKLQKPKKVPRPDKE